MQKEILGQVKRMVHVQTADFSTLFAAVSQDTILEALNNILNICFENASKNVQKIIYA